MNSDRDNNFIESTRKEMADVAIRMLNETISFLDGARFLSRIGWFADLEDDPDLRIFIEIDNQTEHLPVGEVRQYWLLEALEKKQPEIDQAEKWAKDIGEASCKKIIKRFGNGKN